MACIKWNGNGVTPTETSISVNLSDEFKAKMIVVTPIYNGSRIQINGTTCDISLTSTVWSAGYITYPTE